MKVETISLTHGCYQHFRLCLIVHSFFFGSCGLCKCEGTSNDDSIVTNYLL